MEIKDEAAMDLEFTLKVRYGDMQWVTKAWKGRETIRREGDPLVGDENFERFWKDVDDAFGEKGAIRWDDINVNMVGCEESGNAGIFRVELAVYLC